MELKKLILIAVALCLTVIASAQRPIYNYYHNWQTDTSTTFFWPHKWVAPSGGEVTTDDLLTFVGATETLMSTRRLESRGSQEALTHYYDSLYAELTAFPERINVRVDTPDSLYLRVHAAIRTPKVLVIISDSLIVETWTYDVQ